MQARLLLADVTPEIVALVILGAALLGIAVLIHKRTKLP